MVCYVVEIGVHVNIMREWKYHLGGAEMSALDLLQVWGDDLERAIIENHQNEMISVLAPYAEIWSTYVLPHREDEIGSFAEPKWLPFGGSHYSALVRVQNALLFKTNILNTCLDVYGGKQLLELQANTSGFWWSLGCAVDNLGETLSKFPGSTIGDGKEYLCERVEHLDYIYNRRTQLIHSRIVPIGGQKNYALFDYQYLDADKRDQLPKTTQWKDTFATPKDLGQFYEDSWAEAIKELTNAWCHVRSVLAEIATKSTPEPRISATSGKSIFDYLNSVPATPVIHMASGYGPLTYIRIPPTGHSDLSDKGGGGQ